MFQLRLEFLPSFGYSICRKQISTWTTVYLMQEAILFSLFRSLKDKGMKCYVGLDFCLRELSLEG